MDIAAAIQHIYPDAKFTVYGNDYNRIDWLDDRMIPSEEVLQSAWEECEIAIIAYSKTKALEETRTERRKREARMGIPGAQEWLDALDVAIELERPTDNG